MNKLSIVMYHYVRDLKASRYPNIKGLDLKLFKQQIEFFKKNFNFVSAYEVIDALENKKKLRNNSILLTFDDGYIDHYTNVFPILMENNISGFFSMPAKIINERKVLDVNKIHFLLAVSNSKELVNKVFEKLNYYRGFEYNIKSNEELYKELAVEGRFDDKNTVFIKSVLQYELEEKLRKKIVDDLFKEFIPITEEKFCEELYMSYDQIKLMKKSGMVFGSHGYDHSWLGKLGYEDMKNDIDKSLQCFSDIIDKDNWIMCAPYGSFNNEMIKYISDNGCKMGFGTEVGVVDLGMSNRYNLERMDTNDYPPKSNEYLKYK